MQGKVFNFEVFGEEFFGLEARKRNRRQDFQQVIGNRFEKNDKL